MKKVIRIAIFMRIMITDSNQQQRRTKMTEVYKSLAKAEKAFDKRTKEEIVFLIWDMENEVYRLVDEERLDFLENDFNLEFKMIYETC